MSGVGPRSLCSSLFRKLNILHIAYQNTLYLMLFIVYNQKDFPTDTYGLDTRNKNHFIFTIVSLPCVQKRSFMLKQYTES